MYNGTNEINIEKILDENKELTAENLKLKSIINNQIKGFQVGNMISELIHYWRQPLSAIAAIASFLNLNVELNDFDRKEFSEKLNLIENYAVNISVMFDSFKCFYKPTDEPEVTSFGEILQEMKNIIGNMFIYRDVKFEINDNSSKKIKVIKGQIMHVFLSLFHNALEAIDEEKILKGQLLIKISDESNFQVVEIYDNGGGVPVAILDKVFLSFFSSKAQFKHAGLGLSIVKKNIESIDGGTVDLENYDEGVRVRIKIPHC